jgi:hypothetical protein
MEGEEGGGFDITSGYVPDMNPVTGSLASWLTCAC